MIPETTLTLTLHDSSSTGTDDAWCLGLVVVPLIPNPLPKKPPIQVKI